MWGSRRWGSRVRTRSRRGRRAAGLTCNSAAGIRAAAALLRIFNRKFQYCGIQSACVRLISQLSENLTMLKPCTARGVSSGVAFLALCALGFLTDPPAANAQKSSVPLVSAVVDAGSYTPGIAQGSVFIVKGTMMGGSGYVAATAPTYPTLLDNVQISFTPAGGGTAMLALMVYTYNLQGVNQFAAVLPSDTPAGDYDVRVIDGTRVGLPFRVSVVAHKPGIVTADGGGTGPAQATLAGASILQ